MNGFGITKRAKHPPKPTVVSFPQRFLAQKKPGVSPGVTFATQGEINVSNEPFEATSENVFAEFS